MTTPTTSQCHPIIRAGGISFCRWEPVEAWHPQMSTKDRTDAYGVTDTERLRLLLEEDIEQTRRLADAVERQNEQLESEGASAR